MRHTQQDRETRILKLMDAALDLQQAGESLRALEVLSLVREEKADYAPVHLLMGLSYQELGRLEEAESSLRRAIEIDPEYPEAIQALGLLLTSQGHLVEAVGLFRRHLKLDPENPTSLKALSAALIRNERPEDAVSTLQEIWQESGAEEPGVQLGRLLIQLGDLTRAEEVLRRLAEKLPSPRTYAEWGLALTLLERHEDACCALERAIERDPSFDRAWRGLAHCYTRLGKHAEAVNAAERALAINVNHYRNWQAKGDALLGVGRYEEALFAARQGIKLIDPQNEEARPVLFELLRQEVEALVALKQYDEALAQLDISCQRFPEEERFVRIRVSLLAFLERYQDVLALVQTLEPYLAEKLTLYRYEALHALGKPEVAWEVVSQQLEEPEYRLIHLHQLADVGLYLYLKLHPDAARAVFAQLHQCEPREPRFASNLAFILIGDGEVEKATSLLQQALDVSEEKDFRPILLSNLGYLHLLQGDLKRAEKDFQEALRQLEGEAGDNQVILRVAYWCHGQGIPDYLRHPRRFLPIHLYVTANQATLRLAAGDVAAAEALANCVVESIPSAPLGHVLLGTVRLAQADEEAARQAWQRAIERETEPTERAALEEWLVKQMQCNLPRSFRK